jgi:hypothetical protein
MSVLRPPLWGTDVDAARRQAEDGLREAADVFASRLFRPDILQPVNG